MSRKRRGLLFIIVPVLSFIASIILFSNIIYRRVRSNDLERFSIKIKKHRLPNLGVNDYENENCYKPERISTGLAKLVKQLDSASCKRTILNVACLMEKNRLYPQFIQKECQKGMCVYKHFMIFLLLYHLKFCSRCKTSFCKTYTHGFNRIFNFGSRTTSSTN